MTAALMEQEADVPSSNQAMLRLLQCSRRTPVAQDRLTSLHSSAAALGAGPFWGPPDQVEQALVLDPAVHRSAA